MCEFTSSLRYSGQLFVSSFQGIFLLIFQCSSLEGQNASLIQGLEVERQQSASAIKNLEAKLRELQEALMNKVRELGLAYNAHIPLDLEIDAFATLLDTEERR